MCAAKSIYVKDYSKEIPGKLSGDRKTFKFPPIASKNKAGKNIYWVIYVRLFKESKPDDFVEILSEYFDSMTDLTGFNAWIKVDSKVGETGKIKEAPPTIVRKGKNLGKANQTNVFTQALRDALSKYNKQLQKADVEISANGTELYPPMLSKPVDIEKNPPDFGRERVYIQRKMNGVRVVMTLAEEGNAVVAYSRSRKVYPGFPHIKAELLDALRDFRKATGKQLYLDGEAYKHGMDLQEISGIARRELARNDSSELALDYYVYDCFVPSEPEMTFSDRLSLLRDFFAKGKFKRIIEVDTYKIKSLEEANEYYEIFLSEGYEGAIVRLDRPYKYSYNSYRSANLIKMKPTQDGEFKIVGYTSGKTGKAEGELMFVLETKKGDQFTVSLAITSDERKRLYKKMSEKEPNGKTHFENNYLGKMLNIQYQELSSAGIPVRYKTNGIVIRDYE